MRIETIHPRELGPDETARWRALQTGPELASPYLTPDWAKLVGQARDDARVCVIEGGAGFFPAQRLSRFAAMGLGAPIADYQGLVAPPDLDVGAAALCKALKVGRVDLSHVPEGPTPLIAGHREGSWLAETAGGRELYEAQLRLKRGEFVRQTDKKLRKLERERGPVSFAVSTAPEDFAALLAWKREQLARSGQPAIWDTPWVRQTVETCFAARDRHCAGILFTLRVGGALAAANFCLRGARSLHMWIIARDARFEAYSPGVQLARWAIGWAGERGLAEVDLGPGDYRYKRQLATGQRMLSWGVAMRPSWSGALRVSQYALRARLERVPEPRLAALPGKAMRRLDLMRALAA